MANVKHIKRRRSKRQGVDDLYYSENTPPVKVVDRRKRYCYFDGACDVNPGGAIGMGAVVLDGYNLEKEIFFGEEQNEVNSSNVAEYKALIALLDYLLKNCDSSDAVFIRGDSRLVVMQMRGRWRIREGYYMEHAIVAKRKFKKLKRKVSILDIRWIPRDDNDHADLLSKEALDVVYGKNLNADVFFGD